jgi:hypothetical protein
MITSLTITGFRCFRELRVEPLTRVNLIVGKNNAGKTSLLEAIELVATGTLEALVRCPIRRREYLFEGFEEWREGRIREEGEEQSQTDPLLDLSQMFHGRSMTPGTSFSIETTGTPEYRVRCEVFELGNQVALRLQSSHLQDDAAVPLANLRRSSGFKFRFFTSPAPAVNLLGTEMLDLLRLSEPWDEIVLTPEEKTITEALQLIEPQIDRLAFAGEKTRISRRALLKLSGSNQRLPLGSLGDGLRRLLGLILFLVDSKEGLLLVDEIDTGLHYTVLEDVWKLLIETAKRLDVQVFATTHSLDCVRALAQVREKHPALASEATLHRVEKDMSKTITFSADELAIAAEHHLEVR